MKLDDKLPLRNGGYVIVGFARCGQNSLEHWLQKRQRNCVKYECMEWEKLGLDECKKRHKGKIPIIITRDKADRAWSMYYYASMYVKMSWLQFLKVPNWEYTHVMNPVEFGHYENFINRWRWEDPVILRFEEIIKDHSLPKINETKGKIPKLSRNNRKLYYEIYAEWKVDMKSHGTAYLKQFSNFKDLLS